MLTKISVGLLVLILIGCGGKLSDEQRKEMHEKMELNKIVRVTEAEITEAAFAEGRKIIHTLDSLEADSANLAAYINKHKAQIHYVRPGVTNADELEQQLVEAYLAAESGTMQDNVQEKRDERGNYDSLLYTKPVTKKFADGSEELEGIWNVWLSKKDLIISIGKTKDY